MKITLQQLLALAVYLLFWGIMSIVTLIDHAFSFRQQKRKEAEEKRTSDYKSDRRS
jgi:hypothetical protein